MQVDAKAVISGVIGIIALMWVAVYGQQLGQASQGFAGAFGTAVQSLRPPTTGA